jgi:FtsP/CotA-like multicopper oxidase with cupredoxin domain
MPDGRMPTSPDPAYKIPMIKFVIDGDATDNSLSMDQLAAQPMRPMPQMFHPNGTAITDPSGRMIRADLLQDMVNDRHTFTLQRGNASGTLPGNDVNDNEWSINGHPFDETQPVLDAKGRPATPNRGKPQVWEIQNGGGGWVHPMHLHMEEHHILYRNGQPAQGFAGAPNDPRHADDTGKDVILYRNFRTFTGKYVAHCHNLAHEDHAMMFGWEIQP